MSSCVERMNVEIPAVNTKTVELWRCDVCLVRTFSTLQEASDHEKECRKVLLIEKATESANVVFLSSAHGSLHTPASAEEAVETPPFERNGFLCAEAEAKAGDAANKSAGIIPLHSFFSGVKAKNDAQFSLPPKKPNALKKPTRKRKAATVPRARIPVDTWTSSRPKRAIVSQAINVDDDIAVNLAKDGVIRTDDEAMLVKDRSKPPTRADKAKRTAKASSKSVARSTLAATFILGDGVDETAAIAEQRVLEFVAQRRRKEQLEREKNERQRLRLLAEGTRAIDDDYDVIVIDVDRQQPNGTGRSNTALYDVTASCRGVKLKPPSQSSMTLPIAPRFPVPSHVIPEKGTAVELDFESAWKPQLLSLVDDARREDDNIMSFPHLYSTDDTGPFAANARRCSEAPERVELLQSALHKLLAPPDNQDASKPTSGTMWVDRYYNVSDQLSGAGMLAAQQQLRDFVVRFMVERQKAEKRMSGRQLRMQSIPQKQKNSLTKVRCDDDDLWDDDEFQDENETESSLCLITGPVGCGKSQLVHTVAKQLGCRKVLELHTGMKRGAAAMKRCVDEATKSHSTLDMLQNKTVKSAASAAFLQKQQTLVDSDDDDEGCESGENGSAVTVVLIDEVDNLCDDEAGFWASLSDLHKRSKSPIILTANKFPEALASSAYRFTHILADRATPAECALQLKEIATAEGLSFRRHVDDAARNQELEQIATLGKCDLRRIIHELQMVSLGGAVAQLSLCETKEATKLVRPNRLPVSVQQRPRIDSIKPYAIRSQTYTLLTIRGSNFASMAGPAGGSDMNGYQCNVYIGDQQCPQARILNDSTIVAVAAPLWLPKSLDQSGVYRGTRIRSIAAAYAPVTACSLIQMGVLSSTSGSYSSVELPDQSKVCAAAMPFIIEYHFPVPAEDSNGLIHNNDEDTCSEAEFELTVKPPEFSRSLCTVSSQSAPAPTMDVEAMIVANLLREGIDDWISLSGSIPEARLSAESIKIEMGELGLLDELSSRASLASDAALLDDLGLAGMPFLAGPCRGFGFDLTDEFPKRTNENSKP